MPRAKILQPWSASSPPFPVSAVNGGVVACADATTFLSALRPGIADIVFLDPPFNLGKIYGKLDKRTDRIIAHEYEAYMSLVLAKAVTVLKPGGALYLYHLPRWAINFSLDLSRYLEFRHWIAISMKNGFVRGKRLYPAHYALLFFTKGEPTVFERPKIPITTCRHCNKDIKDYGGYRDHVQNGINLSDVWDDLSPVRHRRNKTRASNELPQKLTDRVVAISGSKDGILVDPFAGSGTSLLSAISAQMQFVACDKDKSNVQLIKQRLKLFHASAQKD